MLRSVIGLPLFHGALRSFNNCRFASGKVAVVLSGCGVYDGSEIHEASATAVHLSRRNYEILFYAPNTCQGDVIDHVKSAAMEESRNVLTEAARIARGSIKPLQELRAADADAVVFPGGFGAAKNLSSFASMGKNMALNIEVARVIKEFQDACKPMGFMCIAPVLAARAVPGVTITLGSREPHNSWPFGSALAEAEAMGASVDATTVDQVCVDATNRVVTTAAFMYNGKFHEIFDGIGNLVEQLDLLIKGSVKK